MTVIIAAYLLRVAPCHQKRRPPASVKGWLWLAFVVVAAIETLIVLSDVPVLFDDVPEIPGATPGGLLISATILLSPLFAAASVVLAFRSRMDRGIIALASVALLTWLS